MKFEIVGEIRAIEMIASGRRIRVLAMLRKKWGAGRWRKMKGIALVRLRSGRLREVEIHWYEAHGMTNRMSRHVAVCVLNEGNEVSLQMWKIYKVLPDADASSEGLIRVIDETGEAYLFTEEYFAPIDLPSEVQRSFERAIRKRRRAAAETSSAIRPTR